MIKWPLNILEFYITASGSQFLLKAYALHFIIILGLNITWKCSWQVSWGSFYKNHPVYLQIIRSTPSLTSPSHLRSAPLHLRPPHQEYCLPESPRTRPQMGAGLCRGWRSGHPAESHDWGWWPCEMTLMNPVWKKKKKCQCYKTKIFPLEFDVKGQCGKCTYATRSDCCNNTESNSKVITAGKKQTCQSANTQKTDALLSRTVLKPQLLNKDTSFTHVGPLSDWLNS